MGGQDLHGVGHDAPPVAPAGGQFLRADVLDEGPQGDVGVALDDVPGEVEQAHHRVEVAVRLGAERAAAQGLLLERRGEVGGLPHLPQHGLDAAAGPVGVPAGVDDGADPVEHPLFTRPEEPGPLLFLGRRGLPQDDAAHALHGPHPGPEDGARDGPFEPPHHHRVRPAEGALDEPLHLRRRQRPEQRLQGEEQHRHELLLREDDTGGVDGHGHAVGQQGPPERGDVRHRPHDDGDAAPRDLVDDVGAPHMIGDDEPLRGDRRRPVDGDARRRRAAPGRTVAVPTGLRLPGDPGEGHPQRRRRGPGGGQALLEPADGGGRPGGEPVGAGQGDPVVPRRGVPGEELLVRAAEMEDALVRVAGDDGGHAGPQEEVDELPGGGVEVVGVVDEHEPEGVPPPGDGRRGDVRPLPGVVGPEGGEGGVEQFGGVEVRGPGQLLHLPVLPQEGRGRGPHGPAVPPSEFLQVVGPESPFRGPEQQVTQLPGEPGERQGGPDLVRPVAPVVGHVPAQQLPDLGVVLRTAHEPGQGVVLFGRHGREDGEGPGVHRPHGRPGRGVGVLRPEPVHHRRPDRGRGLLRRRDDHEFVRPPPGAQEGHGGVDDERGLPRPRPAEHRVGRVPVEPRVTGDERARQPLPASTSTRR